MFKSSALATLSIALLVSLPNEVSSKCNDAMHKLQNEISVHVNVNTNNHHNVDHHPHWLREEESNMEVNNAVAHSASESEFDTAVPVPKSSKPHIPHTQTKNLIFDDTHNKDLFAAGDDRVHPHVAESELDEAEADLDSFGEDTRALSMINRIHLTQPPKNDKPKPKPKDDKDPNHLAANGDRIQHGESEIDEAEYDSLPNSMNYDNFNSNGVIRRTPPRNTVFAAGNDRVGRGEYEIDEAEEVEAELDEAEKKKKKKKSEDELDESDTDYSMDSAISDYDNGRVHEADLDDASSSVSSSPDSTLSKLKNKAKGAIDAVHNFFTQGNGHKWMSTVSDFFHPKGSESELDEAEFEEE